MSSSITTSSCNLVMTRSSLCTSGLVQSLRTRNRVGKRHDRPRLPFPFRTAHDPVKVDKAAFTLVVTLRSQPDSLAVWILRTLQGGHLAAEIEEEVAADVGRVHIARSGAIHCRIDMVHCSRGMSTTKSPSVKAENAANRPLSPAAQGWSRRGHLTPEGGGGGGGRTKTTQTCDVLGKSRIDPRLGRRQGCQHKSEERTQRRQRHLAR